MSAGHSARQRSISSGTRPAARAPTPVDVQETGRHNSFEACAATASIFLFAQDSSIICLHHDTLAIERRFERHKERVILLAVDNVSERGAGRLVVSYDVGQTAIVWDLFTGDEIARFVSYERIRVAAWMKNGNVAFGVMINGPTLGHTLMGGRQFPGERHPLRAVYVGTCFCSHNIRSHYSIGTCFGLPDICHRVGRPRP